MEENNKKKFIIGSVILLSIILVLILVAFLSKDKLPFFQEEETPVKEELPILIENTVPEVVDPEEVVVQDPDEVYFKKLSAMFVERFESRSLYNENVHIDDAITLATPKFAIWIESQRTEEKSGGEGITTRVLSTKITERNEEKVSVDVQTQQEILKDGAKEIVYKNGTVVLQNISGEWKVSGWFWKTE